MKIIVPLPSSMSYFSAFGEVTELDDATCTWCRQTVSCCSDHVTLSGGTCR